MTKQKQPAVATVALLLLCRLNKTQRTRRVPWQGTVRVLVLVVPVQIQISKEKKVQNKKWVPFFYFFKVHVYLYLVPL